MFKLKILNCFIYNKLDISAVVTQKSLFTKYLVHKIISDKGDNRV